MDNRDNQHRSKHSQPTANPGNSRTSQVVGRERYRRVQPV
jgi:hypothetical protein